VLRALLLDFNGVLLDDEPLHLELLRRVLAEEGIALGADEARRRFLGRPDRACFAAALGAAGRDAAAHQVERLVARKASYYRDEVQRRGHSFFPGAIDLVRQAAAADLMLGIVSGALADEVDGALRQAGVRPLFKALVTGDDVAEGKPSPEGYRLGMQLLNATPPLPERLLHPHEVLAIEDSPPGIAAARAAGLVTLAVTHSWPAAELAAADVVAPGLDGVTLTRLQALYADASRA
jgi:phosphoglycolate phosphatase/beta-phosphoglucomutase